MKWIKYEFCQTSKVQDKSYGNLDLEIKFWDHSKT